MEFLQEPSPLIIAKANVRSRVHRRVYLDYVGVKRFDATAIWSANSASSACSPRPPIPARRAPFPICGARSPASSARAGFEPSSHSGKALANVLETLSARRAVPDRRGHAVSSLRSRSCSSTSGRACGCCRGATASNVSSRCWSTCRATATTAQIRAKIGDYLASAFNGRVARVLSVFPRRPAGARAFHHRPLRAAKRRSSTAPRSNRAVAAIVRSWADGLARGA